jgi:deoxyribonuclease V
VSSFLWPKNIAEAKGIQLELKDKVKIVPLGKKPEFVAGVDAAFPENRVIAAACLYRYPELSLLEETYAVTEVSFPYIPGFLSFREGPAIIEALKHFTIPPDVVLFDGQGIAHPKGLGIATHIGILLDVPTIGCAKSRLVGEYKVPGITRGNRSPLRYDGKTVGAVLRTRDNTRPVFVSPGHRIDIEASIEIVLGCISKYRLPEPLRRADFLSGKLKRERFLSSSRYV